jgi:cytochrome c-type biogenesis protein CcmH
MIRNQMATLTIVRILTIVLLSIAAAPCWAVMPDEVLKDPALETRARLLSQELRCVVCQNQSIDDSNAPLAHDLRVVLRDRLSSGDSDQQALDFIVARYGNFVLLNPPMQLNTLLLWIGPLLILLAAGIGFGRYVGRDGNGSRTAQAPAPLSENERERIETLLNERSSA